MLGSVFLCVLLKENSGPVWFNAGQYGQNLEESRASVLWRGLESVTVENAHLILLQWPNEGHFTRLFPH